MFDKTKNYKHLEGVKIQVIIGGSTKETPGKVVTMEAALVEYNMGLTLKSADGAYAGICINGKDSPNRKAYLHFAEVYDEDFKFLIGHLEAGTIADWHSHVYSQAAAYHPNAGSAVCATGMPV